MLSLTKLTKIVSLSLSLLDKHPQMNEFLTQIRNTPDLSNLFESVQKDSNSGLSANGFSDPNAMELS